ncbi:MAG: M42 family peptidase [Chloroflexota bacterium]|nr:MAG: M42 family peptidase [Chloroflexota bacterium]
MSTNPPRTIEPPQIGATQLRLLKELCNACAVSGDEQEVRAIVLEQVSPHADDVRVDALGNVLVTKMGRATSRKKHLRVMLAAHMDEIGFILTNNDGDGLFRFDIVGGIDVRQIPGKSVLIGHDHIPGVIGVKPVHLATENERKNTIALDSLRIDIGLGGSPKVQVGDTATFGTTYSRVGPSLIAKALDDRLGVATMIELVKHAPENIDLLAAFTVQEEVGLRGAQVAAYAFDPDLGIAIDSTPAMDLPGWDDSEDGQENSVYNTKLDHGPAIYLADGATLADPRLVRHFVATAENEGIPFQFRQPGGGGTDAGAIHRTRSGVPSISISIPARYIHTAAGIARISDWKNTITLLHKGLSTINPGLLATDR